MKKVILYVHHGKGIGGAPLSLLYLIGSLDRRLYHPIVLFLHNSSIIQLYKDHGIEVVGPVDVYDFAHTTVWWFRWYHPWLLFRAYKDLFKTIWSVAPRILDKIKPDIIHLNTSSLIGWAYVAYKKNIPVVWHVREPLASGYLGLRRWMVTRAIKRYAHTIIPICRNDSLPWEKQKNVSVIYNCVDENIFIPSHKEVIASKPTLLFLGGTSLAKGFDVVLEIMNRVVEKVPNVQCLIAGPYHIPTLMQRILSSRYRHQYRLLKKLKPRLSFLGAVQNVPELMASSTLLLSPFTVSHFARPVIEAGFMKLPVIASAIPPFSEIIIHEKTGFLILPEQYDEWARVVVCLLQDGQLRKEIALAASTFCKDRFSRATYKWHIERIYNQIGEERHGK